MVVSPKSVCVNVFLVMCDGTLVFISRMNFILASFFGFDICILFSYDLTGAVLLPSVFCH